MKRNNAVYFASIGGAGALLSKSIKESKVIAYDDLGAEAIRELKVENFPAIVVIDRDGTNLYEKNESDTIKQLRECDSGVKMGVSSIEYVIDYVHDKTFRKYLVNCKDEHQKIEDEIQILLDKYHDEGKNPNPVAKSMSWIKTNAKLVMNESDETIADLITDGCNMGVKSLSKYLNQYKAADEKTKDITKRLIKIEENLTEDIRQFL